MTEILSALALVMIIEGIMPFVAPDKWRTSMLAVAQQSDKSLRTMGFVLMMLGLIFFSSLKS
ncbi:MAG: DUF2065 domain-containing protein [Kangiellaceae bacterium]|jgi:uncharacterized protein YjeT (DUF2065 family)|nr:DUF2065 domain-containing protein [Kangiellaceae bacterium]